MITKQDMERVAGDVVPPPSDLENRLLILERRNRELRGELAALNHGIEGIIDKCRVVLQTG